MAIVQRQKPPPSGQHAIGSALRDLRGTPDAQDLFGGATINLSQPLPVYRIGLAEISGSTSLDSATQVGWRYLVEGSGGEGVAYADVKETSGNDVKFASLSRNRNAERLTEAAHLAQEVAAGLKGDCEARILDVPALYVSAIWLAGPEPVFIPYIDRDRLLRPDARVAVRPDFIENLLISADIAKKQAAQSSESAA